MSSQSQPQNIKIFVYYYIQNDSFDGLNEPNIFALPGVYNNINQVKVEHLYSSFPIKFENFYLRFYIEDKVQNMKVWMDFPPNAKVPIYNNKCYVKVLRLPKNVHMNFKNNDIYGENINTKKNENKTLINLLDNNSSSNAKFNSTGSMGMGIKTEKAGITKVASAVDIKETNNKNKDIIENERDKKINSNSSSNFTSNVNNPGFSLENLDLNDIGKRLHDDKNNNTFDFITNGSENTSTGNANNSNTKVTNNINNPSANGNLNNGNIFDAINSLSGTQIINQNLNIKSNNPNGNLPTTKDPNANAISELDGLDWNTSKKDLEFESNKNIPQNQILNNSTLPNSYKSNSYPIDNINSNIDEDTLKEKIDEVIQKWLIGVNEKKNLRFILATFYEVWTCDAIWRNVSMQSLIEDESIVKSLYKKALGQTHPDKNASKDFKTRYIADVLYNILTHSKSQLPK